MASLQLFTIYKTEPDKEEDREADVIAAENCLKGNCENDSGKLFCSGRQYRKEKGSQIVAWEV